MSGRDDADQHRRQYQAPYTGNHSIPTVQKYRETKEERQATAAGSGGDDANGGAGSSHGQLWSDYWQPHQESRGEDARQGAEDGSQRHQEHKEQDDDQDQYPDEDPAVTEDTSQAMMANSAKDKRKGMKKRKDERAEREVTDPVTHLPVTVGRTVCSTVH